jgi:hypothetical protein
MSHDFHLDRLPIIIERPYGGGCGCGCSGSGGCGGSAYGAPFQFTSYNFRDKWYAACDGYKEAVDAFNDFRVKVIQLYGKYPSASVLFGGEGKTKPGAKDPFLRSERAAQKRLKALKEIAKNALDACQGQAKAEKKGLSVSTKEQVSLDLEDTAPDNTMLYVAMGGVTAVGLGLIAFAAARKKKKAAAE